jgi:hypothetical protein
MKFLDFDKGGAMIGLIMREGMNLCGARQFCVVEGGAILFKTVSQFASVPAQESIRLLLAKALEEFVI